MGNEVTHVRIRDLDRFTRLFSELGVDGELAQFTGGLVADPERRSDFANWGGPFDPERQLLSDFVEDMLQSSGPDEAWLFDLDRRFDWLHSALLRARGIGASEETVRSAVLGATALIVGPSVQDVALGGQGFTQRLSSPQACSGIADFLNGLSREAVHEAADLSTMVQEHRYKVNANQDPGRIKALVANDFDGLRSFYDEVAAAGHAVLVVRD